MVEADNFKVGFSLLHKKEDPPYVTLYAQSLRNLRCHGTRIIL